MQALSIESVQMVSGGQSLWELEYDTGGRPGDGSSNPLSGWSVGVGFGIGFLTFSIEIGSCPTPTGGGPVGEKGQGAPILQ